MALGPHVIQATTEAMAWARVAPIVKSIDRIDVLAAAPANSIKVFRHFFPTQNLNDPTGACGAILSALAGYRDPNLYVEVWNECHPTQAQLLTAVSMLHGYGYKTCGASWGTGDYTRADFDTAKVAGVDAFCPHAYWGNQGFTLDHALRYRQFWQQGDPPILITECGRDKVEGGKGGWLKDGISADQYIGELIGYDSQISQDSYVLGATPFTAGPTPDWANYSTDSISAQLVKELPPMANVGQGFTKCIPLIGAFLEDEVFEFNGTPNQTSLAVAVNGYATYRPSTNETFAHHNDGRVWADQGNHGTGAMVEIRGPFPVGPTIIDRPSPNHDGLRAQTLGIVLHSTRGGAATLAGEFASTLNWFADPASQVSAHAVIADDGTLARIVDPTLIAWHARSPANETMLGVELVQPHHGDPISDTQYVTLAWWIKQMAAQFGFIPSAATLPEHWEIPEGKASGKTDIQPPFDRNRLLVLIGANQ